MVKVNLVPSVLSGKQLKSIFMLSCVLLGSFTAYAASPGLPFTEDFSDTSLRDAAATNADWSTAEQAAYLKFISQRSGANVTYDTSKNVGTGTDESFAVQFADFDMDGYLDIATHGTHEQCTVYFYNPNNGTYDTSTAFGPTGNTIAVGLDIADADGDGDLDIAVAWDSENAGVNVFFYDPATKTFPDSYKLSTGWMRCESILFGDIDQDSYPDLILGVRENHIPDYETIRENRVYFYDKANNTYPEEDAIVFGTGSDVTYAVAVGDVDCDGYLDIATANSGQDVLYLYNSSNDTFDRSANFGPAADITRAVALNDVNGDGYLDVVRGRDGGSNTLHLFDPSDNSFEDTQSFGNPASTRAVVFGDMDGDGDSDLVVGNYNDQNKIFFYDRALGTYGNPQNFGTGTDNTNGLALADFNRDGLPDIAVANKDTQDVIYLSNSGAGTFPRLENFGSGSDNTRDCAVGDMDNDGYLDIVTARTNDQSYVYFYDDSTGTYGSPKAFGEVNDGIISVAVGDLNGDGYLDIFAGYSGLNHVYLYNPNDGLYTTIMDFGLVSRATRDIAVGDIDLDGDLDVVVANSNDWNRVFFLDSDTMTFGDPVLFAENFPSETYAIALGDVNGDGFLDIAVGDWGVQSRSTVALYNPANNTFDSSIDFGPAGNSTYSIALGDMDNDGNLDLVAGDWQGQNNVYLYDSGAFGTSINFGVGNDFSDDLALGDVNGDGYLDIALANSSGVVTQNIVYLYDPGAETYETGINFGTGTDNTQGLAMADMDRDGDLDLVSVNDAEQNVVYYYSGRHQIYANPRNVDTSNIASATAMAYGDMNGDGVPDLVVGNGNDFIIEGEDDRNAVHLYNKETGTYDAPLRFGPTLTLTKDIILYDLDGDKNLDAIVGNYGKQNKVYMGAGDGTFSSTKDFGTGTDYTTDMILADVYKGHTAPDLLVANYGEANNFYYQFGTGVFTYAGWFGSGSDNTQAIALGDLNADGAPDLFLGNIGPNALHWQTTDNTGDFNITQHWTFNANDATFSVAIADLYQNGALEVIVGNAGDGTDATRSRVYFSTDHWGPLGNVYHWAYIGGANDAITDMAIGDVDGDGDLDIAAALSGAPNVVYRNAFSSGFFHIFSPIPIGSASESTKSVALTDIDSDGDLDVAVGSANAPETAYLLGIYDTEGGALRSIKVNDTETGIARVTLTTTDDQQSTTAPNGSIVYHVSNDGGDTWRIALPGQAVDFTAYGDDLRWKATLASLSPVNTPKIESLTITENLISVDLNTAATFRNTFTSLDVNDDGWLSISELSLSFLAELKPYDTNDDGEITIAELLALTVGPVGVSDPVYVNFSNAGTEDGAAPETGFNSLFEGSNFVASGGVLILSSGITSEIITLDTPMTLQSSGTARIGVVQE